MNKIRKIVIILMFILMIVALKNATYAADKAALTLTQGNTNEEQVSLKLSVANTEINEGISLVAGILDYDKTIFELVPINTEELTSEQQMIVTVILDSGEADQVLAVTDNYIVLMAEEQIMVLAIEEEIKVGTTTDVGEIKFKILNSESSESATIKVTGTIAETVDEQEVSMPDASVTISSSQGTGEEDPWDEPEEEPQTPTDTSKDGYEEQEENNDEEENEKQDKDEAKQDIVYTGAEDVIPFIAIILIIAIVSYIKYRKYKCI